MEITVKNTSRGPAILYRGYLIVEKNIILASPYDGDAMVADFFGDQEIITRKRPYVSDVSAAWYVRPFRPSLSFGHFCPSERAKKFAREIIGAHLRNWDEFTSGLIENPDVIVQMDIAEWDAAINLAAKSLAALYKAP